jgi:hypothetical protein
MNPNVKPKLMKEAFTFFRKENLGYASIISPGDPSKALHLLNPTAVEIAEMFTGERTLEEIKAEYATKYKQQSPSPLSQYIDQTLYILYLYNLIDLQDTEKELPTKGSPIPKVRKLEEWDFSALRNLFNGGEFPAKESNTIFHFLHPYVTLPLYSEMILRMRIFNRREFFYAITTGSRVDFAMSFYDERPLRPLACLGIIIGIQEYSLDEGVACILPVLIKEISPLFHKLEWRYATDEKDYSPLIALLENFGFAREAVIPDEFGPGSHEVVYGRILSPPAPAEPPSPGK